jgi:thioredoxin 1
MVQAISSKEEFDNLLKEKSWVIIADFYATWCWPCKVLAPIMEELSEEHPEVTFVKVDVDEVWELAEEYWISSIPTVFIWYNHEIQEGFLGAYPKDFYEDKIEHALWEKKA